MSEVIIVGLDIAKHVFHAHGVDERGRQRWRHVAEHITGPANSPSLARSSADPVRLCKTVREATKERRDRCRGDLRSQQLGPALALIPLPLHTGWVGVTLVSQLSESRVDAREDRSFSELGKDPISLGQVLDGAGAISLAFVEQAKDHFSATDMMAINIKLRVASNLGNKCLNRSTPDK